MEKLKFLIGQSIENGCYYGDGWKREFSFSENGDIVSFRDPFSVAGIITNVVHVTKKSRDGQVDDLIERLNESYDRIRLIGTEDFPQGM